MKRKFLSLALATVMVGTFSIPDFASANSSTDLTDELSVNNAINLEAMDSGKEVTFANETQEINISYDDVSQVQVEFTSDYDNKDYEIGLELPVEKNAETYIENDNVVSEEDNYSVITEAFDGGMQINFVIEDEAAPEEYTLEYDLPEGFSFKFAELEGETDGSIEIVDNDGTPIGAVAIPWAKDANGKNIKTFYEIDGNTIHQIVKHKNSDCAYPVVADPYNKYSDWFKSATWKIRDGKYSLCVVPTAWNRQSGLAYMSTSWALLKKKKSGSSHWYNTGGLKDQYYCHTQTAKLKSSWNLEPWRPDVSLAKTIAKLCNP